MSELEMDSGSLEAEAEVEPIDENDLIDVYSMDFEDNDRWLSASNQCSSESRVHDLYAWLKSDPSEPQEHSSVLKKSIDTRTFTRAKRRSNKLNFDAIMESLSSPARNSLDNTFKVPGQFRMDEVTPDRNQEIPAMLRPKTSTFSNFVSNSHSSVVNQESLEVFLNLSQSKGIDSFINLTEPEFADCIMNESQPSLLYSSMMSSTADESKRNESLCDMDSGILSESMMQASIFQESLNINSFTEICSRNEENSVNHTTQILDQSKLCAGLLDQTKICVSNLNEAEFCASSHNETKVCTSPLNQTKVYNSPLDQTTVFTSPLNQTKICTSPFDKTVSLFDQTNICVSPLEKTFINEKHSPLIDDLQDKAHLTHCESLEKINQSYSVVTNGSESNESFSPPSRSLSKQEFDTSTPEDGKFMLSETFENLNTMKFNEHSMENALIDADMTFNLKRLSCQEMALENSNLQLANVTRNVNNNNNQKLNASSLRQELLEEVERSSKQFDSTFSKERDTQRELNITYENSMDTFPAPLDYCKTYRKEGLKKIDEKCQNFSPEVDRTRFQTFRKSSVKQQKKSNNDTFLKPEEVENVNATFSKCHEVGHLNETYLPNDKLENVNATFSRIEQSGFEEQNINTTYGKPLQKAFEVPSQNNANSTFCKPNIRKLPAPKTFSKLPQFLQKSNPNIPTSNALRTLKPPGSFGYSKGSQPNIHRNLGLYALGKYKSETDQRLVGVMRGSTEQIGNAGGSTESIESTQSAPDLDDRLSICSDSSRSSYTISTTARTIVKQTDVANSRILPKLIPRGLKPESTPKPNRQILENTWVQAEKDLPSPILRNNTDDLQRNISPHSDLKSSSPLLTPSSSSENINSFDIVKNNAQEIKPPKVSEKLTIKAPNAQSNRAKSPVETKMRLRPPTNYNAARPVSAASGIPRPTSRIPAPKFTRPLSRIQDPKKG